MAGIGFFILLIGLLHALAPRASWWMSIGWKLRDAEPSDAYLMMTRVGGIFAIVVGVILMISGIV